MNRVIVTLTTVPERLSNESRDGFRAVISSLCEQNYPSYEVHLNLPEVYKTTNTPYEIPSWLYEKAQQCPHLKIFRTEDIGPPTKVVPTITREAADTLLVVVDDDLIYHSDMLNEHVKYHEQLPDSVVLYDGRSLVNSKFGDLRDAWVLSVGEILQVKELQHYKSASYFVKYFGQDFFDSFLGKTQSDDVLMSYYFKHKKIKMFVVPYEPDIEHTKTYEQWQAFQGVTTFPVLRHARSIQATGCSHPESIKIQPKFFIPEEFKHIDKLAFS